LKDKTGVSVQKALKEIFKQRIPEKLWTDKGKAFCNRHVNVLGVGITLLRTKRNRQLVNAGTEG